MMITASSVTVNGTTLVYNEEGTGQPMLFIHGMCGDAVTWSDQMRRLSPVFRCVAYDRRGHSRSPLGEFTQRSVQLHADDAAQLILKLGIHPCILVGSSSGGRIAVDVMRRFPDLVKGAVLSEPPLLSLDPTSSAPFMARIKSAVDSAMTNGGPRAAVDAFFELVCPGFWPGLDESRREAFRTNADELIGDLTMPSYQISRADLARIGIPSLVVSGSTSDPMMRSVSRVLAESLPNARFVELEDSGHVTYAEKPEEFASAVTSFVASL
jgi:pimeloyl-ACP methyl ester carboxylesterase